MAELIIDIPPFTGSYELATDGFTGDELHEIKKISGVRAGELSEAITAGDYDLVVAFAVIALRRAGVTVDPAQIMAATVGSITVIPDEEVEPVRPPASAATSGDASSPGGNDAQPEPNGHSGSSSSETGVLHLSRPAPTGSPGLVTSAGSDQLISAS